MECLYNIHVFSAYHTILFFTTWLSLHHHNTACVFSTHNALPHQNTYSAFDSLWEEKPLVDSVDSVVGFNITLPLQQNGSGVQSIISPEHCEPAFFVPMDQGPVCQTQQ